MYAIVAGRGQEGIYITLHATGVKRDNLAAGRVGRVLLYCFDATGVQLEMGGVSSIVRKGVMMNVSGYVGLLGTVSFRKRRSE